MKLTKESLKKSQLKIEDIHLKQGFQGNLKLKRPGEAFAWTAEQQEEYFRCSQDPVYFVQNYIKVIHVDHGLVPLKLWDYQLEMLKSMAHNRNTIITTARQIGKSTVTCAFITWYVIFHSSKTVALLANKGDTAREIMNKVHIGYMNLPKIGRAHV